MQCILESQLHAGEQVYEAQQHQRRLLNSESHPQRPSQHKLSGEAHKRMVAINKLLAQIQQQKQQRESENASSTSEQEVIDNNT